ncbi:hypothetical protein BGY98DRAFT_1094993 [Russula aff. rugulosa BPL654]|nr:hypothetical protein BGY98DRAFT_1094993 [Russula aff. rugulosa BPL654]
MAKWNQNLPVDLFLVQPSSHLTICLYAKRSAHSNILIGINELEITLSPQRDIPFVLENGVVGVWHASHIGQHYTSESEPAQQPPSIPTEDNYSTPKKLLYQDGFDYPSLLDQATISTEIYCVSNSTSGKTLIIYVRYWKLSAVYCSLVDYLQLSLGSITPPSSDTIIT